MSPTQFLVSFKSVWGGAVVAATAGPLGLWAMDLEPPWPPSVGKVATLFCAVAVLLAYVVSRSFAPRSERAKTVRLIAITLLAVGLTAILAYLWAYSHYVVTDSIERSGRTEIIRMIVGSTLRPGIEPGTATQLDLLRDNLYDPEAVWTRQSISTARMILLISFVLSFFMLTFGAALLAPLENNAKPD
jgi:multisubunit Na+/H+ antiporter MnhB subunit